MLISLAEEEAALLNSKAPPEPNPEEENSARLSGSETEQSEAEAQEGNEKNATSPSHVPEDLEVDLADMLREIDEEPPPTPERAKAAPTPGLRVLLLLQIFCSRSESWNVGECARLLCIVFVFKLVL